MNDIPVGCPIILPRENESVLLGAAILGSVASNKYTTLHSAMKALNAAGEVLSLSLYLSLFENCHCQGSLSTINGLCVIFDPVQQVIHPSKDPKVKKYHDAKYKIFRSLYEQQLSHRSIMAQALS